VTPEFGIWYKPNTMFGIRFCALFFTVLAVLGAHAAPPSSGGAEGRERSERRALLDALRIPVQTELNRRVVFEVRRLKIQGDWAFLSGVPQLPDGRRMDYGDSPYKELIEIGHFDDGILALWRKNGRQWKVVQFVIGATDAAFMGWDEEFGAPPALFE
jgi:hypothetical protein